jgi:hypothetical protein
LTTPSTPTMRFGVNPPPEPVPHPAEDTELQPQVVAGEAGVLKARVQRRRPKFAGDRPPENRYKRVSGSEFDAPPN